MDFLAFLIGGGNTSTIRWVLFTMWGLAILSSFIGFSWMKERSMKRPHLHVPWRLTRADDNARNKKGSTLSNRLVFRLLIVFAFCMSAIALLLRSC
jgi:hypothetical protein